MKPQESNWTYINEFRRYKDSKHQLFYEGKWIDIKTGLRTDLDKT